MMYSSSYRKRDQQPLLHEREEDVNNNDDSAAANLIDSFFLPGGILDPDDNNSNSNNTNTVNLATAATSSNLQQEDEDTRRQGGRRNNVTNYQDGINQSIGVNHQHQGVAELSFSRITGTNVTNNAVPTTTAGTTAGLGGQTIPYRTHSSAFSTCTGISTNTSSTPEDNAKSNRSHHNTNNNTTTMTNHHHHPNQNRNNYSSMRIGVSALDPSADDIISGHDIIPIITPTAASSSALTNHNHATATQIYTPTNSSRSTLFINQDENRSQHTSNSSCSNTNDLGFLTSNNHHQDSTTNNNNNNIVPEWLQSSLSRTSEPYQPFYSQIPSYTATTTNANYPTNRRNNNPWEQSNHLLFSNTNNNNNNTILKKTNENLLTASVERRMSDHSSSIEKESYDHVYHQTHTQQQSSLKLYPSSTSLSEHPKRGSSLISNNTNTPSSSVSNNNNGIPSTSTTTTTKAATTTITNGSNPSMRPPPGFESKTTNTDSVVIAHSLQQQSQHPSQPSSLDAMTSSMTDRFQNLHSSSRNVKHTNNSNSSVCSSNSRNEYSYQLHSYHHPQRHHHHQQHHHVQNSSLCHDDKDSDNYVGHHTPSAFHQTVQQRQVGRSDNYHHHSNTIQYQQQQRSRSPIQRKFEQNNNKTKTFGQKEQEEVQEQQQQHGDEYNPNNDGENFDHLSLTTKSSRGVPSTIYVDEDAVSTSEDTLTVCADSITEASQQQTQPQSIKEYQGPKHEGETKFEHTKVKRSKKKKNKKNRVDHNYPIHEDHSSKESLSNRGRSKVNNLDSVKERACSSASDRSRHLNKSDEETTPMSSTETTVHLHSIKNHPTAPQSIVKSSQKLKDNHKVGPSRNDTTNNDMSSKQQHATLRRTKKTTIPQESLSERISKSCQSLKPMVLDMMLTFCSWSNSFLKYLIMTIRYFFPRKERFWFLLPTICILVDFIFLFICLGLQALGKIIYVILMLHKLAFMEIVESGPATLTYTVACSYPNICITILKTFPMIPYGALFLGWYMIIILLCRPITIKDTYLYRIKAMEQQRRLKIMLSSSRRGSEEYFHILSQLRKISVSGGYISEFLSPNKDDIELLKITESNRIRTANTILYIFRKLTPLFILLEGAFRGQGFMMTMSRSERILLGYGCAVLRSGYLFSPLIWISWTFQLLMILFSPSSSSPQQHQTSSILCSHVLFLVGLSSIRVTHYTASLEDLKTKYYRGGSNSSSSGVTSRFAPVSRSKKKE